MPAPASAETNRPPCVVVTRPVAQAPGWVQALRDAGLDAVSLPLITIAPVADAEPARNAWEHLQEFSAVMFVSANAVEHFFCLRPAASARGRRSDESVVRAWVTGAGTRRSLRLFGWPEDRIDAPDDASEQFDSETLWRQVQAQVRAGSRVLIVRGADDTGAWAGRDWLSLRLVEAGAQVEQLPVYRRMVPVLAPGEQALAQRCAAAGSVWLFSSSEAIRNLSTLLPRQDWRAARALVTHVRIGEAARAAGFGVVWTSRPALADVVASIKSSG